MKPVPSHLLGLPFSSPENDCVTLVIRYYKELYGIDLPMPERPPLEFWGTTVNSVMHDNMTAAGYLVTTAPKVGDLVIMDFMGGCPCHIALLLPNQELYHIFDGEVSKVDSLTRYQTFVCFHLTHPLIRALNL